MYIFDQNNGIRYCHMLTLFVVLLISVFALGERASAEPLSIAERIYLIKGTVLQKQLEDAKFKEEPEYINLRIYKADAKIEVWGGINNTDAMTLLKSYEVCAMDFQPGTKLREGDERTPEGTFELKFQSHSKNWFMHISLLAEHLNDEGDVKRDPSFYVCTNYPTKFDKELAKSVGIKRPGSAICIHGNCVSAGCPSMTNSDYLEIYYWLTKHNITKYGQPRVSILPFEYYNPCEDEAAINTPRGRMCLRFDSDKITRIAERFSASTQELQALGVSKVVALWNHIGQREREFIKNPTPENAELNLSMDILKDMK